MIGLNGFQIVQSDRIAETLTDDQLRAECERRGIFPEPFTTLANTEVAKIAEKLAAERDEWKRRAEAAEQRYDALVKRQNVIELSGEPRRIIFRGIEFEARPQGGATEQPLRSPRFGPGDEPTGAHRVDPLDLLADDE